MEFGLKKEEISQAIEIFRSFPSLESVIIFGSRAMGNHKTGSDVDLALVGVDENIASRIRNKLNEETSLPYFFDVVSYESVGKKEFKEHIDEFGKVFYQKES